MLLRYHLFQFVFSRFPFKFDRSEFSSLFIIVFQHEKAVDTKFLASLSGSPVLAFVMVEGVLALHLLIF